MRPLFALSLLLGLGACVSWRRDPHALNGPIPRRQPLQIWSGNHPLVVHGVQVRGDSLRAVPRWKPPDCDTCAVFLALPTIDSVRVRRPAPVRTGLLGAVLAVCLFITIGIAGYGGPSS